MKSSATISECGLYRYRLERHLGDGPTVLGIMINPSWADATYNDRTISRWIGFANRYGWGRIIIGNKFAFRSQYPRDLHYADDPIGPDNDAHLIDMFGMADICISAWGPVSKIRNKLHRDRWRDIKTMADQANQQLLCWGVARDGHPLHPLMLPYSAELRPWIAVK